MPGTQARSDYHGLGDTSSLVGGSFDFHDGSGFRIENIRASENVCADYVADLIFLCPGYNSYEPYSKFDKAVRFSRNITNVQ